MQLTIYQRQVLRQGVLIVLVGITAGWVYVAISGQLSISYALVNGLTVGFLISFVLAVFELWFFRAQKRHLRFISLFVLRSLFYLVAAFAITFNVFVISRMRRFDLSYTEVLYSEEFAYYLQYRDFHVVIVYALLFMSAVNFVRQLSMKVGQGLLIAYLTGKYRKPRRSHRVIVFLDLIGSKKIIEKLGSLKFHEFLNDWAYDITDTILRHDGTILHYVEDEVVLSWSKDSGFNNANCIRTVIEIQNLLRQLGEQYYKRYGFTPGVRAAMHYGPVISAEVGMVKTEISIFGDAVNTTSRILDECHRKKEQVLISSSLAQKLMLPAIYEYTAMGAIPLKGKEDPVELYTIQLKEGAAVR